MSSSIRRSKKSSSSITVTLRSPKDGDRLVTRSMLKSVKTELKAEIRKSSVKLESRMDRMEITLNGRMDHLESTLTGRMDHLENSLTGQMQRLASSVEASVARMELLYEEQKTDNKIALEAIVGINQRLDRLESERL